MFPSNTRLALMPRVKIHLKEIRPRGTTASPPTSSAAGTWGIACAANGLLPTRTLVAPIRTTPGVGRGGQEERENTGSLIHPRQQGGHGAPEPDEVGADTAARRRVGAGRGKGRPAGGRWSALTRWRVRVGHIPSVLPPWYTPARRRAGHRPGRRTERRERERLAQSARPGGVE